MWDGNGARRECASARVPPVKSESEARGNSSGFYRFSVTLLGKRFKRHHLECGVGITQSRRQPQSKLGEATGNYTIAKHIQIYKGSRE